MLRRLTHLVSCKEASRLLSQAQEEPLPFRTRVMLRLHLIVCDKCTRFLAQLRFLRKAMHRYRS